MELPKHYDEKGAEQKWQEYWEKNNVYRFDSSSDTPVYSIDTPPPTISGYIHMGHAFSYSQADFIARFQRMNGKNVFYPFGFDDNGLATERLVEKERKIRAQAMSRDEFIKICLEVSAKYEKQFRDFWGRLGLSCDWSLVYSTIDDWCRKTSQRSFIELYKLGREYRKESPTMWCPDCQTAIAQVELQDKDLSSSFNHIIFKTAEGEDLMIATTRPELLPACVAVFANPEDERYKPHFNKKLSVPLFGHQVTLLPDHRAAADKGTGLVMCCTFGDQTDMEWYHAHNLPLRIAISRDGRMNELAGKYSGKKITEARKEIIEDLKQAKLLTSQQPINHFVNVHERCGTAVEILVTKQWFIEYLDLKDEFIEQGRKLNWYPPHMRVRYDNWIKGLQWDWCISRQRYFGIPFPVWYCKDHEHVIIADDSQLPVDPLKDKPPVELCPKCGCKEFIPEKDIFDTWATSSLTPQINCRWMDDEDKWKKLFPMSLRPQAHDIITFWLFNTVVKSYLHNKTIPWKDVMISGHGLDSKGKKMSKSLGNVVQPQEVMEKYSADCLRYWAAGSKLGDDLAYLEKDVVTGKKVITKIWNATKFVIMNLEGYEHKELPYERITELDRWLLSELNKTIQGCTDAFKSYEYAKAKALAENFFFQVLCDNYLEVVKGRFYNKEAHGDDARLSAQYALYTANLAVLKLLAPVMPYITEETFQLYFAGKEGDISIHTSRWPVAKAELINSNSEMIGRLVCSAVESARKAKTAANLSLKTPVKMLTVKGKISPDEFKLVEEDIKSATSAASIKYENLPSDSVQESESTAEL
jgi:valyl-tRNA synthetase